MGQKVNPISLRIGGKLPRCWESNFYEGNKRSFALKLSQDFKIRDMIHSKYKSAQISRVYINRSTSAMTLQIFAKKPGVLIGKNGNDIDGLKKEVGKIVDSEVYIDVHEVKRMHFEAALVAESICQQIEKRVSYKKAMKTAVQDAIKQGVKGIKIRCAGRLGGAEIAKSESCKDGNISLHTLSADVDYSLREAKTAYGIIGVKVWINRGSKKNNFLKK